METGSGQEHQAAWADYAAASVGRRTCRPAVIVIACGFGIALIAVAILTYANFKGLWDIAPGRPIRPMALAVFDLLGGGGALLLTFVMAVVAMILGFRWKRVWVLAVALLLAGFVPVVAGFGVYRWIINVHHLVEEP